MFTFYWLYQSSEDWLAVFKTDETYIIANDRESLKTALSSVRCLVSYSNYKASDKFLAKILSDGKSNFLQEYLSIDLSQEERLCTIEEIGFNLRFDMRASTAKDYCKRRIAVCEKIFDEREEYLETKFEIVKEFNLPSRSITKTRANLAAEILQAKKIPKRPNILMYEFDKYVPQAELPKRLVNFYQSIKSNYQNTLEEKLKVEKFKMTLSGLTHVFGFGGVHAAKSKYKGEGYFLLIDVNQFFPSLIINNNFISTGVNNVSAFADLYQKKVETGKLSYKVLINAVNGSMNNPYSNFYDPRQFYSVTVSGQLIITHLILVLGNFYEDLIQTNTDGILVRIDPVMENTIRELLELWCKQLHLQVSITRIKKVWQKDVSNFVLEKDDGGFIRKGIFKEPNCFSNSLEVVSAGTFEAVVNGVKPQNFVVDRFKDGEIEEFYYINKLQGDFQSIEQEMPGGYRKLNNTVCGVATKNKKYGGVYQVKKDLHSKLPNSPARFLNYMQATKKDIDVNWYVEQIERLTF
ncbi:hypothetical protein [Enterococcus gilvus]|uniref:hypothetical protein n=1 Tax=Enterococcus gilvus TaxID=160453 RepID=UPI0028D164CB|nr:hypothetical protein [Enterococcus gilvus]